MGQSGVYFYRIHRCKKINGEEERVLIGTYEHAFDAKGRVFIPAKWRENVEDVIVVIEGILGAGDAKCLFGMSIAEWERFSEKLAALPLADLAGQAVKRRLYASAAACEIDKQGRILIPAALRDKADITKDATLIGVGNRLEIWSPSELTKHEALTNEAYDEALTHLASIGI